MFRRPSSIILHLCGCSLGVDLIIVAHDLDAGDGEEARGAGAGVGSRADERGSRTAARIPMACISSGTLSAPRPLPCPPRGRDVPCGVSSQSQRSSSDVHAASRRTMLSFTLAFFYSCFLPATSLEPTCSGFLGATYPCFLRATYSCFLPDLTPSQLGLYL